MCVKKLFFILPLFIACHKVEIPSYLKINPFSIKNSGQGEGTISSAISDAWVYIDDNLIGTFELPCKIPISTYGVHKITVKPGIFVNGLNTLRSAYVFYKYYETEKILTSGETTEISPETQYIQGVKFPYQADFNNQINPIVFSSKSNAASMNITTNTQLTWNNSGGSFVCKFDSIEGFIEFILQDEYYSFPKQGALVYLELDYLSSHPIDFLLESYYPGKGSVYAPVLRLNSSSQWKKVYIYLTEKVSLDGNSDKQRILFNILKKSDSGPANFLLDNIRVVHFKP